MSTDEAIAMSQDCVCRTQRESRVLRTIYRRTQIDRRHLCIPYSTAYEWVPQLPHSIPDESYSVSRGPTTSERMKLYAEHATPLAVCSASEAIRSARVHPSEITHLVAISCTGFEAPGVDVGLIDRLSLSRTVERVHVGFMGCHGAINGMRVVLGLTAADRDAHVLLVATELCSLHFCLSREPDRLLGNALFADGSAAMVCKASSRRDDLQTGWRVVATGSRLFDGTTDAITWRIGDFGFEMSLSTDVPELIKTNLRQWLDEWLAKHRLSVSAIGSWAIHPGGPKIIDAVEESLDLLPGATAASREVLQSHGNMSSPTVLFIMERLQRDAMHLPCVVLSFGPGLVVEAALIES